MHVYVLCGAWGVVLWCGIVVCAACPVRCVVGVVVGGSP